MAVLEQENSMTPRQASKYVGITENTLRFWRSRGAGPRYFKAGEKLIRYRLTDLDRWIESRLSAPGTSAEQVGTQMTAQ